MKLEIKPDVHKNSFHLLDTKITQTKAISIYKVSCKSKRAKFLNTLDDLQKCLCLVLTNAFQCISLKLANIFKCSQQFICMVRVLG